MGKGFKDSNGKFRPTRNSNKIKSESFRLHGRKATGMYSKCIWCGKDDATYMKKDSRGTRTWCARCKSTAGY